MQLSAETCSSWSFYDFNIQDITAGCLWSDKLVGSSLCKLIFILYCNELKSTSVKEEFKNVCYVKSVKSVIQAIALQYAKAWVRSIREFHTATKPISCQCQCYAVAMGVALLMEVCYKSSTDNMQF